MKLYELANEYAAIELALADSDGEITPEIQTMLDSVESELPAKVDGICSVFRHMMTRAAAAKEEAERILRLYQVRERAANRLKEYLKSNLERMGMTNIETDRFKVRIQKNSAPSVKVADGLLPEDLPAEYVRFKPEVNNSAIAMAWKAGKTLPDGVEVKIGTHLRIS